MLAGLPTTLARNRRLLARRQDAAGPTRCAAGCARCCEQLVPVSRAEVADLAAAVAALPADTRNRVRRRAAEHHRYFDAIGLLDLADDPADVRLLAAQWADERVPCPLLESGRCVVYDRRPIACRVQAVTSDPVECGKRFGRVVPLRVRTADLVAADPPTTTLAAALARICEAGGVDCGHG